MGTHDHVPHLLQELGVTLHITKLKIKPGKPFLFGTLATSNSQLATRFVFGLPGNPVSSFVCTTLFASPLLTRLAGGKPSPRILTLPLASPLPPNGPREFYQPVRVEDGQAHPLNWKGSSDVFTLAAADGLIVRPESQPALPAGSPVEVIPLLP
jgi:molybdopterin molybdotransferase